MDFRTYIDQYLSERGSDDPLFATTEDGQNLLRVSRDQDLQSRMSDVPDPQQESGPDEIRDVDELAHDASSLTPMSEPANDMAVTPEEIGQAAEASPSLTLQPEPAFLPPEARVSFESDSEPAVAETVQSPDSTPAVPSELQQSDTPSVELSAEIPQSSTTEQATPREIASETTEPARSDSIRSDQGEVAIPAELVAETTPVTDHQPADVIREAGEPATAAVANRESGDPAVPNSISSSDGTRAVATEIPPANLFVADSVPAPLVQEDSEPATPSPLFRTDGERARVSTILTPPGREAEFGELLMQAEQTFEEIGSHTRKVFSAQFTKDHNVQLPSLIPIPDRVLSGDDPSLSIFNGMRDWVRQ